MSPHWPAVLLTGLLALSTMGCQQLASAGTARRELGGAGEAWRQAPPLYGGDTRAWPTAAGDAADSGYCAAPLRLPLQREPSWIHEYGIEFSSSEPTALVHYDGLLVVASQCPLLLGLEVETGRQLFNSPVYEHLDDDDEERLDQLFFHPRGLLVASDDRQRHYCWDLSGAAPRRLWLGLPSQSDSGFVVSDEAVITGWESSLRSLAIEDGGTRWSYPDLLSSKGVVLGADGTVVSWRGGSAFFAVRAADGALLWSHFTGVAGYRFASRAVIDNSRARVYLVLPDERVQCRGLATGELQWEHRWTDLLSPDARDELFAGSQFGQIPLFANSATVTPDGLVLALVHGAALALDNEGNRRWVYESDFPVLGVTGFSNAVLISESFLAPEFFGLISWLRIYCPETVDWERYLAADERRQRSGMFQRLVILDPGGGEPLDYFEPLYPARMLLPARDKIIMGEMTPDDGHQRILAYDWLAAEGT